VGQTGYTSSATKMVCVAEDGEDQPRWRAADGPVVPKPTTVKATTVKPTTVKTTAVKPTTVMQGEPGEQQEGPGSPAQS